MKVPSLPKPKPRAASARKGVQMPRFVDDLYRDLRDRRLLLPVALLIIAIVAVPVVLKAPKEEPPAALAFTPPAGSEAVAPAVLAEQPIGVRDYRQRLDELKSKNPFASNFSFPDAGAPSGDEGGAGAASPVVPSDGGTTDAGGSTAPSADTGGSTDPATPSTPSEPSTGGGGDSAQSEILILAPRLDVRAGRPGELRWRRDVELGDILPHPRKAPVAIFLSAKEDLRSVTFLVSSDVTATDGDGACRPSPENCQFLRLKEGDRQTFVFGPQEAVRVIKIRAIREEIVDRRKVADR